MPLGALVTCGRAVSMAEGFAVILAIQVFVNYSQLLEISYGTTYYDPTKKCRSHE